MLGLAVIILLGVPVSREIGIAIYNLYFHPLRPFNGPTLWIAFPVFRYIAQCRGTFDMTLMKLHEHYGEVVRFDADNLSFTTAQAWKDIYGYGHGQNQWPKLVFAPPEAPEHILFSSDTAHAKFRKALSHAFSEQALRLQEPLIAGYIDKLIKGLREEAQANKTVDMTMWYNLTTFDIISDLAFGEPSDCLEKKAYSDWIVTIFRFIQLVPYLLLARFYPNVWKPFSWVMGKTILRRRNAMATLGNNTITKRKSEASKRGRADFMEALLKHSEKDPISDGELAGNTYILFMAGSETTATLLSGLTYWMLRTPETLTKATQEVRSAFAREEDITFASASAKLPYMLACIEEGLRKYPSVPTVLLRRTPEPATISGYNVPPQTFVGVHQLSANNSLANFFDPDSFRPERWLSEAMQDPKSPYYNDNREARQPFSVGPRNCIGKNLAFSEMRQILARILWNFDLEMVDQNLDWSNQKIRVLWDKGPLACHIKVREGV